MFDAHRGSAPPALPAPSGADGSLSVFGQLHPLDYVRVLYRRRWLAAVVVAVALGAIALHDELTVPMYQAQTTVLIEPDTPKVVNFQQVLNDGLMQDGYFQTQLEVLKSRALAQRTAAALHQEKRAGFDRLSVDSGADAVLYGLDVLPVRGTRMLSIRYKVSNPVVAADVANAHARAYIQQSLDSRFHASKEATEWLDAQLAEERTRVEQREKALQAYREQHDAVSLTAGQNIIAQKLADLSGAVTRAKTDRIEKEAQYREWLAIRQAGSLDSIPAVMANPFIQQLKGDLSRLQREYAELSESLGARHPTLVAKQAEIDTAERRLTAEVDRVIVSQRSAYQAAQAQESSLVNALEDQKREALAQNRRGIEYAALEREAESERLVYQSLLQRAKETGVSEDLRITNIRVVDPARVPTAPVSPRRIYDLIVAACGGLLVAVGLVFGLEYIDDRTRTPDDVLARVRLPVVGMVPEVRRGRGAGAAAPLLQTDVPPLLIEAVRAMRTSLLSTAYTSDRRSIVVTSARQGEGKTFVASSLAIALAQGDERVLLIDADMRRPAVHRLFGLPLDRGLSSVLAGNASMGDVLRPTSIPGLTVLTAGQPTTAAPELLGSPRFHELFDVLQEHFSWVIIDSPPVLSVTDASLVARRSTGVLLVVASGKTRSHAARLAVNELRTTGATVLGAVLTRAELQQHPFYFAPYSRPEYVPMDPVAAASDRAASATSGTRA